MNNSYIKQIPLLINELSRESIEEIDSVIYGFNNKVDESPTLDEIDDISLRYLLSIKFDGYEISDVNDIKSQEELLENIRNLIKTVKENEIFIEGIKNVIAESSDEDILCFCLKFMCFKLIDFKLKNASSSDEWTIEDAIYDLSNETILDILFQIYKLQNQDLSIRDLESFEPYHAALVDVAISSYNNPPKNPSSLLKMNNKKLIHTIKTNYNMKQFNDDEVSHIAVCQTLISLVN